MISHGSDLFDVSFVFLFIFLNDNGVVCRLCCSYAG